MIIMKNKQKFVKKIKDLKNLMNGLKKMEALNKIYNFPLVLERVDIWVYHIQKILISIQFNLSIKGFPCNSK